MDERIETFRALKGRGCVHGFTLRAPSLDAAVDRELALARLEATHTDCRRALGLGGRRFITAGQVHGRDIAFVHSGSAVSVPNVDGLITADRSICLGIYVADCCAIFLYDPVRRAAGLLHSGRKGSELEIAGGAIERMERDLGCKPTDIIVQLSPCIRPPCYEVDFAAQIVAQCRKAGITQVNDCGLCTACDLDRYYSYRAENGKTGRMLALLAIEQRATRAG